MTRSSRDWRRGGIRKEVPLSVCTLAERPDLAARMDHISASVWPEFMRHDEVANRYWGRLLAEFPGFQVFVCEGEEVVAAGNTIPVVWEGTAEALPEGWDAAFEGGARDQEAGREPTAVSALSATVAPERALDAGGWAALRPLAAGPQEGGGRDPAPRVALYGDLRHRNAVGRLGGDALPRERPPESGRYVVPGALEPIEVDRERDVGLYVEPNVWMRHKVVA